MQVLAFRTRYKDTNADTFYSGWLHGLTTLSLCLGASAISIAQISDLQMLDLLVIPASFLYANFIEYGIHRWPLHHQIPGARFMFVRHTLEHHAYFTDEHMMITSPADVRAVLFPPIFIVVIFVLFATPVWFALEELWGKNVASLFTTTSFLYLLNYETFHLIYHLPENSWWGRIPGMKLFRRSHTLHHRPSLMTRWNFNVVYPISDIVLGTFRKE